MSIPSLLARLSPTVRTVGVLSLVALGVTGWLNRPGQRPPAFLPVASAAVPTAAQAGEPLAPLPALPPVNREKVKLGRKLFEEKRLSKDNTISCATCHDLAKGGTDQLPFSHGMSNARVPINTPTVLNSVFNDKQFWNGRADSLEEQVEGPVQGEKEMASSWPDALGKLRQDPEYIALFHQLYPDGIQKENVKDAIATYERTLITPNGRFDRFLKGDTTALTTQEQEGYKHFKALGCAACHQGVNVGGNMFARFGLMEDYFAQRGGANDTDNGRYNITHDERDRYVFKVPSLRNITHTSPYFHDGSTASLRTAVLAMARFQLGRSITPEQADAIVAFLGTLDGALPSVEEAR